MKKIKGDEKFVHMGGGHKKLKYVVHVADCISGGGGEKTIFEGVRVGVMCRTLVQKTYFFKIITYIVG